MNVRTTGRWPKQLAPSHASIAGKACLSWRVFLRELVQGFIKGAYGAAIGTILGACVLLGRIAIGDWLTALVTLVSLVVLFRWKVSNPLLIAAAAMIGLIAFPLLQPPWVFVK